jgi:hypothetical protein
VGKVSTAPPPPPPTPPKKKPPGRKGRKGKRNRAGGAEDVERGDDGQQRRWAAGGFSPGPRTKKGVHPGTCARGAHGRRPHACLSLSA